MRIFLFYTDPGSGAMLLQVLLAFLASGLFYFRNSIKLLFSRVRGGDTKIEEPGKTSEDIQPNA